MCRSSLWVDNNLDMIFSLIVLAIGFAILYLSFSAGIGQYGMGLAFLLGPITYYFVKKKDDFEIVRGNHGVYKPDLTLFLITNSIYFFIFALSVIILQGSLYVRPPVYFIIVAIAFLSIFVEIFNGRNEGFQGYFIIAKIMLLSLSFRGGRFYSYPTIPGVDTHFHLQFTKSIIMGGDIYGYENATQYLYTPLWHIFEAMSAIIINLNLADSLVFSIITTFVVILSLFVFLISRDLFNVQIGLIALIFVNIADMLFVRGVTNINTSSFVHIFLIMTLFCLIQQKNRAIYSFFTLVFMLCSILTHQLSTFAFFVIIFALLIGKHVYLLILNNSHKNRQLNINNNMVFLFLISMSFYWTRMGPATGGNTFFSQMVSRLDNTLIRIFNEYANQGQTSTIIYGEVFSQFDMLSNILYNLGYSILVGLAVVGMLILLNRNYRSEISFSYICAAITLFAIIYPGTYIGLGHVFIPHRFISHLELFLIIFAAFSVYTIYTSSSNKCSKLGITVVTMFLIFFMITTPFINRNDAIYCTEREYRTEYTYSELKAIEWGTTQVIDGMFIVDPLIKVRPLSTVENLNIIEFKIQEYPKNLDTKGISDKILVRQYVRDNPNLTISGTFGNLKLIDLSYFLEDLSEKGDHIYSIGSASVYMMA